VQPKHDRRSGSQSPPVNQLAAALPRYTRLMEAPAPESPPCTHRCTRLIARDQDAEFRECLDCGKILEKTEAPEPARFDESLSDA
jgi:hypothetical protein